MGAPDITDYLNWMSPRDKLLMNKASKQQRVLDARLSPPKDLSKGALESLRVSVNSLIQSNDSPEKQYIRKQYLGAYSGCKTSFVDKRKSL